MEPDLSEFLQSNKEQFAELFVTQDASVRAEKEAAALKRHTRTLRKQAGDSSSIEPKGPPKGPTRLDTMERETRATLSAKTAAPGTKQVPPAQDSHPGQDPPPTPSKAPGALGQKISAEIHVNPETVWKNDTRSGITAFPFYTIADDFKTAESVKGVPELMRAGVVKMWYEDRWAHLMNPPTWVTVEDFFKIIPSSASNTEAWAAIDIARANLSMARLRANPGSQTVEQLLGQAPSAGTMDWDNMGQMVTELKASMGLFATQQQAMLQVAAQNLVQSEKQICDAKSLITSFSTDIQASLEHKMLNLTTAISASSGLEDTDIGKFRKGSGSIAQGSMRDLGKTSFPTEGTKTPSEYGSESVASQPRVDTTKWSGGFD